ncbi:DUF3558 domain-containing protein [Actinophytocola gossypii]|uniref:DUF3558 domain-containing protein n=1 Tax=Actinophytocola gossypii TaxID=2812003 RepID=A0ABT2JDG6_9PSEU|nr:DUF3558 domain-containing protein [Actinophytocola gossypii]MCT2585923.1 DUF3558 domain-containing protein [Actinophytocola gossypii]
MTFAAALAVGLSGCSSETPGNASPTENSGGNTPSFPEDSPTDEETTSPSESESGTTGLEPCELFTEQDLAALGLPSEPKEEEELGPARSCYWQTSGSHLVGVGIIDELGIDQVQSETPPEPLTVGSHDAVQYTGALDVCAVSIAVTDSSRVDVSSVAGGDMAKACDHAKQAAELVEPKLP